MNFFTKTFSAGEITPSLYGRVDLSKYATGVRTMRNFYVSRSGGAYNRPGTKYCTTAQDQTKAVRLVRFTTQAGVKYQLELGHLYVRPLEQGMPIMTQAVNLTNSTSPTSGTVTLTGDQAFGFAVNEAVTLNATYASAGSVTRTGTVTSITSPNVITVTLNSNLVSPGTLTTGTLSLTTQRTVSYAAPWTDQQLRQMTFSQDQNVLTIASQFFFPRTFTYNGRQAWSFDIVNVGGKNPPVSGLTITTGSPGTAYYFAVTMVDSETFEESFPSTIGVSAIPLQNSPVQISWNASPNAAQYNVYSGVTLGNFGFRTVVYNTQFTDYGTLATDYADPPPIPRTFMSNANPPLNIYASVVGTFQQRRWYANLGPVSEVPVVYALTSTVPPAADRMVGSRIGSPTFFAIQRPLAEDDPVSFRIAHKEPQIIRHILDLGKMVVFTEQGEWVIQGGDSGITPGDINPTCASQNGSGYLAPLAIGNVALYRQNKGSIVRTFGFEYQIEGYRGDDLTVFSKHLVDGQEIVAWDFQKLPDPVIWMARSDGTMLGLTFVPEQAIVAWSRHDFTNGFVEDVCQSDDRIYLVIRRVINGQTVRYIERLHTRITTPITSSIFVDASITYNGTLNPLTQGVSLVGGTTWGNGESITINAVGFTFTSGSLPSAIHITGADGTLVRMTGLSFVSATQVTGTPQSTIPVSMRSSLQTNVRLAQSVVTGLGHLEGQQVSVIGDGFVVSSPNNSAYPTVTVVGGQVTLPQSYGIIHVGLPITADLETLNIDTAQGQTIMDKQKAITKVSMWVEQTRGLYVGAVPPEGTSLNALQGLEPTVTSFYEPKVRYSEGFSKPNQLLTRVIDQNISGSWTSHGRVIVRQVDPLPCAVLAIAPAGLAPVGM